MVFAFLDTLLMIRASCRRDTYSPDANCPINIDSKSYETTKRNIETKPNSRYIFDEAAGHVYQLMKNDSYPRYLRSEMYKEVKQLRVHISEIAMLISVHLSLFYDRRSQYLNGTKKKVSPLVTSCHPPIAA